MGRDSSVGIVIRYGLDGPGIESWLGVIFSPPVQTGPEAHPASCTMGTGSFLGVKGKGKGGSAGPIQHSSLKADCTLAPEIVPSFISRGAPHQAA
jgi:hypothetical protein